MQANVGVKFFAFTEPSPEQKEVENEAEEKEHPYDNVMQLFK